MGHARELLRGGARRHEPVKPGDRAACDRDEEEGNQGRGADGFEIEGGCDDVRAEQEQPGRQDEESRDELVRVQVVAWLQQQPDRKDRGDEGIEQEEPDPGPDFDRREKGEGLGDGTAVEDCNQQYDITNERRGEHRHAVAVDEHAEDHGDEDLDVDGEDRTRCGVKECGDDVGEDREHDPDQQRNDHEEQGAHSWPHDLGRDVADGPPAMACADHEGRKVVRGAHRDGSDADPDQRGHPSPDDRNRGAYDRGGTRDRREVVSPEYVKGRRQIVDAVFQLSSGNRLVFAKVEDATGEESGVEAIAEGKDGEDDGGEQGGVQAGSLPRNRARQYPRMRSLCVE